MSSCGSHGVFVRAVTVHVKPVFFCVARELTSVVCIT